MEVSTGSTQSVVTMTVRIDDDLRANYQGYFQSVMRVPAAFHGNGFEVTCGEAGVDGVPGMGHAYDWTLRAADSAGNETSNQGTVTCPPLDPIQTFIPLLVDE
jgi:hypothetical protein